MTTATRPLSENAAPKKLPSLASLYDRALDRVKTLDWEPSYVKREPRYPTAYKIPGKTKDPFKTLIRQYCAMEKEKDDRQYGSLTDVLSRTECASKTDPRWAELQKILLPVSTLAEYMVGKSMGVMIDAVENPELRQGYLAQMMDEVRHYNQETNLIRHWAKNWEDPEGFAAGMQHKGMNVFGRAGRAFLDNTLNMDPVTCSLMGQIVGETAYTNPLFVATTELAAVNGDNVTPTVFLSVQSDEARHMANGYATLAAVLSEPDNLPLLQRDLDDMWWRGARFLDPFLGFVYDYGVTHRLRSYADFWNEWVWEDWGASFMARLEPFGLKLPKSFEYSRQVVQTGGHAAAIFAFAAWPLNFHRFDAPTERDYEWLENAYPGWYDKYGMFWEMYHAMTDPKEGAMPLNVFAGGRLPVVCRTCQVPAIFPEIDNTTERIVRKESGVHGFCSQECEDLFDREPFRYLNYTPYFETYDGWNLADVVVDLGLVRTDGKTLIAQPSLDEKKMWTVDDVRRCEVILKDPVREYAEEHNL